jgi:hypothetical protein
MWTRAPHLPIVIKTPFPAFHLQFEPTKEKSQGKQDEESSKSRAIPPKLLAPFVLFLPCLYTERTDSWWCRDRGAEPEQESGREEVVLFRNPAMEWLDEYEKLVIRMDTPKVVIDNAVCPTATLVQVCDRRNPMILFPAASCFMESEVLILVW